MLENYKVDRNSIVFFFIFFVFFLFSAFRNGLGTDYYAYGDFYRNPQTFQDEFLFKLLFITIPRFITKDEIFFYIISSFVVSFYFLKSIFKHSELIFLSVLIYFSQFYFISYNAIRQFIAIALFLYFGQKLLTKKGSIAFILLILVLAQIHFSIYFMLIFPILGVRKFSKKAYLIIWGISFIFFQLQSNNILNLSSVFSLIPSLSAISSKFDMLEAGSEFFFGKYSSNNQLILKNIFFIFFVWRLNRFKDEKITHYWLNLFLLGLFLQNILVKFSLFAVRIAYYGDVAQLFLIPMFIKSFKDKNIRIAWTLVFVLYFTYSFYTRFVLGGESEVFRRDVEWME